MAKKPLEIDMIAGSQLRDIQNEILSVEGTDISELEAGRGFLNDNHGKGFFNHIGRITKAKKIFKEEDCDDDRQRYYWGKVKAPYIYVAGQLYDDDDHHNAKACAAILRNIHKSDCPLKMKASVEGGVIARDKRDPSLLARTKLTGVALTFVPANSATLVEPISLDKSNVDHKSDLELIKSVMHLAQNDVPSFRHIHRDASASKVHKNLNKIFSMLKEETGLDFEIPSKQTLIEKALETKIENNINKIFETVSDHRDELEKGKIKNALMSATMAASSMAPKPIATETPSIPTVETVAPQAHNITPDHKAVFEQTKSSNPLLAALAMTESSAHTAKPNYAHRTITAETPNKGHTAGGMFGMMPNSAAFMIKKDPALAKKYPKLAEAAKDIKKNHGAFTDTFNNDPKAALDFANSYFNRNKSKTKSQEQLIYSWLNGLKGSWNKHKKDGPESFSKDPYVQKVLNNYNSLKQPVTSVPVLKSNINKGLSAGYGGASAPDSRFGGAVLQSEAIDSSPKGFRYIDCDKCGEEQVYGKNQVKCRKCGNAFSLHALSKFFDK